ncbi:thioredoxin [Synechococcales cyanobacterium C]|uniref:Thioredoxin n=1 Tax=Petrachloros mirabilis ULC683 TaxID=2781853 RepID=A0A8K2A6M4_9CYAN|nr:thioredoxin family protein [Petrachloros mirabilis]NCJ06021.1 thioredoxin [Petrachloros mirabilis ULC683]
MLPSACERTFTTEVLEADVPVVVSFWAPWCGLCRLVDPILTQVKLDSDLPIKLVRVNADENLRLSNRYRLTNLPTLLLFHQGHLIKRLDHFNTRDDLRYSLEQLVTEIPQCELNRGIPALL